MEIVIYSAPYYCNRCQCTYIGAESIDYSVENKRFNSFVAHKPMAQWLLPYTFRKFQWHGIIAELLDALNETQLDFVFFGLESDYEVFRREINIQLPELSYRYTTKLEVSVKYGGNPCNDGFIDRIADMLEQTIDAFHSTNIEKLIQAKKDLKNKYARINGQMYAQMLISDNGEQLFKDAGLSYEMQDGILQVYLLDSSSNAQEQSMFCIEHASYSWNCPQHNKRVYMLDRDRQESIAAIDRFLTVMRKRGYIVQNIIPVTSFEEIASDIRAFNYFRDCYIPETVSRAIDEFSFAMEEIPSNILESELQNVKASWSIIQRPCEWIHAFSKR